MFDTILEPLAVIIVIVLLGISLAELASLLIQYLIERRQP